jgi:AP-2 complex subunit alpha
MGVLQECNERLRGLTMKHLSRFINIREPNIRYLGLEAMSRIAKLEGTSEEIRKQQAAILVRTVRLRASLALVPRPFCCGSSPGKCAPLSFLRVMFVLQVSLKDADISLRRRALDLLYAICHQSNAEVSHRSCLLACLFNVFSFCRCCLCHRRW